MKIIKIIILGFFSLWASYSNAQTATTLISCNTAVECQDNKIKSSILALASSGEDKDFIVYDVVTNKSYHYKAVNITGLEFPGPVIGVLKVKELPSDVSNLIRNYRSFLADPIGLTLDDISFIAGTISGYDVYYLDDFYSGVTLDNYRSLMNTIATNVNSRINTSSNNLELSLSEQLTLNLGSALGSHFNFGVSISAIKTKTFYLHITDGNATVGLKFNASLNGGNISTSITSISIVENGQAVFEIPVENNVVNIASLIGQSFSHGNPGSLRTFFQSLNMDLRFFNDCKPQCITTITDINNDDVGEVEKP